ncbi:hypothetical protein QW131_19925 [Roseibium salinum]|nr:hypothetical protein [Roseibium salinum]
MRAGLIASLAGHTAILVWGLIAFPDAESFSVPQVDSLPVELVPVEELTKLRIGEKTAEVRDVAAVQPSETPSKETPKPADKPGESKVQQPTQPTPAPTPAPAPAPEPEPVAEPEPAPEPEPAVEPEPAPEPEPATEPEPAPEPEPQQEAAPEPQRIVTNVAPRTKPTPPRQGAGAAEGRFRQHGDRGPAQQGGTRPTGGRGLAGAGFARIEARAAGRAHEPVGTRCAQRPGGPMLEPARRCGRCGRTHGPGPLQPFPERGSVQLSGSHERERQSGLPGRRKQRRARDHTLSAILFANCQV